jgi:hypothetical protein
MASAGGAAAAYLLLKQNRGKKSEKTNTSRKWECIQIEHHKDIGRRIEEWESNGWVLHTYSTALFQSGGINHYLLFLKEE